MLTPTTRQPKRPTRDAWTLPPAFPYGEAVYLSLTSVNPILPRIPTLGRIAERAAALMPFRGR